jgi:flagellar hook-length control protein FliK
VVTTPAGAAPAATPEAVAEQIVSAVVPLHGRGDGRHDVTLELRPADLGTIRVEVSVEHQTVHLTLHAAEPATGKLLAAALPELRSSLADAGLTAGHVGVGPDGSGAGQRRGAAGETDGDPAGPSRRSRGRAGAAGRPGRPDPVRLLRPAAAGRLDLFL